MAGLTTAAEWVPALADSLRAPQSCIVAGWLAALVVSPLIACGDPFRYRPMFNVYLAAMLLVIVGLFALKIQGSVPSVLDRSIPIATTLASGLVLWRTGVAISRHRGGLIGASSLLPPAQSREQFAEYPAELLIGDRHDPAAPEDAVPLGEVNEGHRRNRGRPARRPRCSHQRKVPPSNSARPKSGAGRARSSAGRPTALTARPAKLPPCRGKRAVAQQGQQANERQRNQADREVGTRLRAPPGAATQEAAPHQARPPGTLVGRPGDTVGLAHGRASLASSLVISRVMARCRVCTIASCAFGSATSCSRVRHTPAGLLRVLP
ncbi:MAG: hypothetical protein KatS3mg060_2295 [Dehalococcoidia bacterium]|nr:MAG: hypothetical protein KatS3mg060_2295 [Dehalococcoidia bacterium]